MNLEDSLKIAEICIKAVIKNMKAKAYGSTKGAELITEYIEKDAEALETVSRLRTRLKEQK